MTRRLFIALLSLFSGIASAEVSWTKLPDHPRIFADAERFASLKKNIAENDGLKDYHAVLKARADSLLKQPPVTRTLIGKRLLATSRQALECILVSAMVGKLDDSAAYKQRAIEEMRALAGFTDWNPKHFLDVAEATFAMGTGYDWLYDDLTPADRDLIATAIIEKGLKPSFPAEGKRQQAWIHGTNNWNQVCHSGMTIGALAIADRDPELAKKVVTRAVENLKYSAKAYAPDGIYPEGPGYWAYGTDFHLGLVEALRTSLGGTQDLEKFPGFMKTPDFIVQMEAPSGKYYSFADNGRTRGFETSLFWFARELKRPELLKSDLAKLSKMKAKAPSKLERMMALGLLWWDGKAPTGNKQPPASWSGAGKVPLVVFRGDWSDPNTTFLAAKGGRPSISHGHMDGGSFILESGGVRWAEDLGVQSYNTLESRGINLWDYRQNSPRWTVFRLGSESHNIPRFNGKPQNADGDAKLEKIDLGKRLAIFDLTSLHTPDAESVKRGFRFDPDGTVVIRDEWKSGAEPATVTFQWLTTSEVSVDGGKITLKSRDKTLQLNSSASGSIEIAVDDLSKPVRDFDLANPGLKRIRISVKSDAGSTDWLAVASAPSKTPSAETTPLATW